MTNVVEWIGINKQWIFDGIGGVVLTLLIGFIVWLVKRKPEQTATPANAGNAANSGGTGNTAIGQVTGPVIINQAPPVQPQPRYNALRQNGGNIDTSILANTPAENIKVVVKQAIFAKVKRRNMGGAYIDPLWNRGNEPVKEEIREEFLPAQINIFCHNLTGTPSTIENFLLVNLEDQTRNVPFDKPERIDANAYINPTLMYHPPI